MKNKSGIKSENYRINVVKDANGYAAGVRCGTNHSGNHLLAGPTNGYWECCGCQTFFGADAVAAAQKNPALGGEIGQGGLIARV